MEEATLAIEAAGFEYRPGAFPEDREHRFFRRREGGRRTHHVHLLVAGSAEISAYLALRNLLRRDASARASYDDVKRRLAEAHPHDRDAYIEGKAAVVVSLTSKALRGGGG